jgi:hypothetical protein
MLPKTEATELNIKSVKLSGRDIEDARRLLWLIAAAEDQRTLLEPPSQPEAERDTEQLVAKAREILANRRRRIGIFGKAMFDEFAWEMLLVLYALDADARQTVSRLTDLSGATKTTALRWLSYLETNRLVSRVRHPTDNRTIFVELTAEGRQKIELYLTETSLGHG